MPLRDVSELLYPAVCETIAALGLDPSGKDAAAAKLAKHYARLIDQASEAKWANVTRWLGPELQKILESLGATPAARAAMKQPKAPDARQNRLQQLRAARGA